MKRHRLSPLALAKASITASGCGAHGTAIGFLMEYDHMDFVEAIEALAGSMGVEVPRAESDKPARRYDELFSLMDSVARHWQATLKDTPAAVEYLKNRGIDGSTAKRFGIGFSPDGWSNVLDKFGKSDEAIERLLATGLIIRNDKGKHYDRFRDRVMFPIRDARGPDHRLRWPYDGRWRTQVSELARNGVVPQRPPSYTGL